MKVLQLLRLLGLLLARGRLGREAAGWSRLPLAESMKSPGRLASVPGPGSEVPGPSAAAAVPGPPAEVPAPASGALKSDPTASGGAGTNMESDSGDGLTEGLRRR